MASFSRLTCTGQDEQGSLYQPKQENLGLTEGFIPPQCIASGLTKTVIFHCHSRLYKCSNLRRIAMKRIRVCAAETLGRQSFPSLPSERKRLPCPHALPTTCAEHFSSKMKRESPCAFRTLDCSREACRFPAMGRTPDAK